MSILDLFAPRQPDNADRQQAPMIRDLHNLIDQQRAHLWDREATIRELRQQLAEATTPAGPSIASTSAPGGLLPVHEGMALRSEIDRLKQTLLRYEDRLARYEGRPSPVACPRACCAEVPQVAMPV